MTPTDTLLAILDPDPVLRGRQFERFVVTLLRTHPLIDLPSLLQAQQQAAHSSADSQP